MKLVQILLILSVVGVFRVQAVTIVYNLRIAETTRLQRTEQGLARGNLAGSAFVNQYRRLRNDLFQRTTAGIGTYVRTFGRSYVRVYGAVGHVADTLNQRKFERTQTDDILFSAGRGFKLNEKAQGTISGILGVPTHKDDSLEGIQFGTGHYGIGVQGDASYIYAPELKRRLFGALRFIHFFPRNVQARLPNLQGKFNISLGNLFDLFLAHQSSWNKHSLTLGYNGTLGFNAEIKPPLPNIPSSAKLIRNSIFVSYLYRFFIDELPSAFLLGLSYSRDSKPKTIGAKYTVTMWAGGGINF